MQINLADHRERIIIFQNPLFFHALNCQGAIKVCYCLANTECVFCHLYLLSYSCTPLWKRSKSHFYNPQKTENWKKKKYKEETESCIHQVIKGSYWGSENFEPEDWRFLLFLCALLVVNYRALTLQATRSYFYPCCVHSFNLNHSQFLAGSLLVLHVLIWQSIFKVVQ